MSCARCGGAEDGCKVSLTPNVHEALCAECFGKWVQYAMETKAWRNTLGAVVGSFRRWCEAGRRAA